MEEDYEDDYTFSAINWRINNFWLHQWFHWRKSEWKIYASQLKILMKSSARLKSSDQSTETNTKSCNECLDVNKNSRKESQQIEKL